MKLVFMGTPDFAVVTLKALITAGHDIICTYSQPPRPAGRGQNLRLSPVHSFAETHGIETRTPLSLRNEDAQERFAALKAEAAVVVAYGLILPREILTAPRLGCFNIHASLLPRWRGAAPIQRAIMAGEGESGVCIMQMDERLDTGPVCGIGRVPISAETTAGILHDELAELGSRLMVETLGNLPLQCKAQPTDGVTYARKIEKSETHIDFTKPAQEVRNHIHGLSPFPGAWGFLEGARVKILTCEVVDHSGEAGAVLDDRLTVACGSQSLRLITLQREGKAIMDAKTFLRGFPLNKNSRFT